MRVPYTLLKKIIPLRLSPEVLAERLTMAGLEVENIEKTLSGEAVLNIAVTSNRPDCLGIIGIAREVNAILASTSFAHHKITLPTARFKESRERTSQNVNVVIQNPTLCHRYVGRLIKNVKVRESPSWLKERLLTLGLRPINNIVDVTNYVLMEYGQPLHAFDFARIRGQKIIVRHAREGEEFITLDGVTRRLDRSILVIADSEKPQALAGIIGGRESEVSAQTKDIFLESAYFERGIIRRASKELGLSTDSSYRFERGGDKEIVLAASKRAVSLIQELAGGEVLKGSLDLYPHPFKPVKIYLRLQRMRDILGVEIEKPRIKLILDSLGLKVEKIEGELWRVNIPSFRRDISSEIDLIEEIARHFGYGRIPATLPAITVKPIQKEFNYRIYDSARDLMVSNGFQEVVNFSFHSFKEMEIISSDKVPLQIKNPISEEQGVMRMSLLQGLLATTKLNLNRGERFINIFESGEIFFLKKEDEPEEEYCMSGLSLENSCGKSWRGDARKIDFYDLKGVLEVLLDRLGIIDYDFKKGCISYLTEASSTFIYIGTRLIGWLGELNENVLNRYDIHEKAFFFELYFSEIIPCVHRAIYFKEPARYPASFRDISIIIPEGVENKELSKCIRKSGNAYLEDIELMDLYRGEQIPPGHTSLTYRLIFRSPQRTLREEEVNDLFSRIVSDLKSNFAITLR